MNDDDSIYCPVCQATIVPEANKDGDLLYIHEDVEHTDEELEALWAGVQ